MEPSTRIIELYGLPGCGKSTLCSSFKELMPVGCVADINDMFREARKLSFWRKLGLFPGKLVYPLISLWLTCPIHRWGIYRAFLKRISIIYYINKYSNKSNRYVILDHGIVQCVHSLYLGIENRFTPKAKRRFLRLLNSLPPIIYVFCDIPARHAFERMRSRNTLNHGRLDCITDERVLMEVFRRQEIFFADIYNSITSEKESCSKKLDVTVTPEMLAKSLAIIC